MIYAHTHARTNTHTLSLSRLHADTHTYVYMHNVCVCVCVCARARVCVQGVSLRAPSSIVVTTTPGSRLVRTHDQPVSLEAITTKLDLGAKSDHSSKAHLAATNPHSESDESIGDKGVAGAHPVRQEDDPDSGVGVADAGAEVAGDAPDPLSPKRKKSPQQLVFKPDIRQTPPSSPKSKAYLRTYAHAC